MKHNSSVIAPSLPLMGSRFVATLPGDSRHENFARQVDGALYSLVKPSPVPAPRMLLWSSQLGTDLGLDEKFARSEQGAALFCGNVLFPGSVPYATRYGGHQFGHWAGQLGDGRAINLGELPNSAGAFLNLQLKGAGSTPYSRGADGRAVLRSSVREFLCSEAMYYLGVPTTRALSLALTGDSIIRDMFYDGHPQEEPGAIVCRVSSSFTRFGHFQLCAYRGETDLMLQLLVHTIDSEFPHLRQQALIEKLSEQELILLWFKEVCFRTGDMIVAWMRVGFVHGVMNTDNMSIIGETIDYGPYGWIDHYDPEWTPNTTDAQMRRYRFGKQADIALWNLYQLANALLTIIEEPNSLEAILEEYAQYYENAWSSMMVGKLGLNEYQEETDKNLLSELLALLSSHEIDMTIFFRALSNFDPRQSDQTLLEVVADAIYGEGQVPQSVVAGFENWQRAYSARLMDDGQDWEARRVRMNSVNPWFVLRNYLAQEAIDRAHEGDYQGLQELYEALQKPYTEQPRFGRFFNKRPEWARHKAGASMLSCSS